MLRITQNSNASTAVKYFDEGLSRADYYEAKGEVTGLWGGKGAALLGLSGAVERGAFHALCHNADPATGARLTARSDVGRTTGYDFTFSVPKSVSLVHSQTGDPDILAALDAAVAFAMSRVERDAQARVRKGGRQENRTTGNLCWASFTHDDARPVGGVPDPHLHAHVFVFNATYDAEEKLWKAGQFRNLKAEAPYYEALFNNRLAYGLLLTGDTRQHTGVARGDALRILQKFGGVKPAHLGTIRRQQKEEYKEAVAALAQGRTASGFAKLERMGAIKDGGSFDGAVAALAAEYVQARRAREETLVVAPTHGQGRAVTAAIRAALKEDGKLAKTDRIFEVQTNLSLTGAQKADPASYAAGQAVQFHQNVRGFVRGERCEVIGPDGKGGVLVSQGGKAVALPTREAKKFSVYRREMIGLAEGDLIRVTQNGFSQEGKRLSNGNVLAVRGFDDGGNILAATSGGNPVTLGRGFGNFAHGYYTTSPGAQGKSVNRVLVLQTTQTGRAASSEQFYVSASRGRFEISVHTDDKEALLESVQRSSARMSATELAASAGAKNRAKAALGRVRAAREGAQDRTRDGRGATKPFVPPPQDMNRAGPPRSR